MMPDTGWKTAAGAAGIRGAGLEEEVRRRLKERYGCRAKACDDGVMALYAKLQGQDGLMVIAGTGSVAYGKAGNQVVSCGGWGMLLDDRGSGTAIVLDAFRSMVSGYDEGRSVTVTEAELLKKIRCTSPKHVPRFLYQASKREIAALMPVIAENGEKGEADAVKILECAGRQLAQMAMGAVKRLELKEPPVAVSGSILERCGIVLDTFWETWTETYPGSKRISGKERVEKGALWFYREQKRDERANTY